MGKCVFIRIVDDDQPFRTVGAEPVLDAVEIELTLIRRLAAGESGDLRYLLEIYL